MPHPNEYTETFEQILKDTMPQTPGIIRELALRELRLACREFFERSYAWIEEVPGIDTAAGNVPTQIVVPGAGAGPSPIALLADMDGADGATTYTERSVNAAVATFVGNAELDTAQFKFGTASLLMDGAGDYQSYADTAALALGSGPFTIEGWVRLNTLPSDSIMSLVSQWEGGGSDRGFNLFLRHTTVFGFSLGFEWRDNFSGFESGSIDPVDPVVDQWFHFAIQRDANDALFMWWDGAREFNSAPGIFDGAIDDSTVPVKLGVRDPADTGNEQFLDGWLDDVRISTVEQYDTSGDIAVPTEAFPIPAPAADPNVEVIAILTLTLRNVGIPPIPRRPVQDDPDFTSDAPRGWFITSNPDEFLYFPRLETSLVGETCALVAVIPSFDTLLLPRQITLKFYDAIIEGYLARVYNHPNKPYSNPAVAAQLRHSFLRRIGYYMAQRKQGFNNSQQWTFPPGWNVRRLGGNG